MKTKTGEKITTKEFFKRWKGGIESITPLQQIKVALVGNVLVVVGVLIGLVTMFIAEVWWLFIILCGSLFLTSIGLLGNLQKCFALQKVNKLMEEQYEQ